jgi:hypothetical protein
MDMRAGNVGDDGGWIRMQFWVGNYAIENSAAWGGIERYRTTGGSEDNRFFWYGANDNGVFRHEVPHSVLDPDDYVPGHHNVSFINNADTNNWNVKICWVNASDAGGDHTANLEFDTSDTYSTDLTSNCSTGHYASSGAANRAEHEMQRTKDRGDTWGYPSAQYGLDGVVYDPSSIMHLAWIERPKTDWMYRNTY